jgi:hypothetical protein
MVKSTPPNNAFKFALATRGEAFEEAKAHPFTKPGLAKVQGRLECETL